MLGELQNQSLCCIFFNFNCLFKLNMPIYGSRKVLSSNLRSV